MKTENKIIGLMSDITKHFGYVPAAPCQHIADYYYHLWSQNPQLGTQLLRRGYTQWSCGFVEARVNNLFGNLHVTDKGGIYFD
jgi:hypothetical protein